MSLKTRGRTLLLGWAAKDSEGRTQTAIARAIGVTQPSVRDWMMGLSRPRDAQRIAVERLTDGFVERDSWMTEDERDRAEGVEPMRVGE